MHHARPLSSRQGIDPSPKMSSRAGAERPSPAAGGVLTLTADTESTRTAMDAGLEAVDHLRARLQVDPEWSIDISRGFAWWAHEHRQDVYAEPPFRDDPDVARMVIRTELATGIDPMRPGLDRWLVATNRRDLGGAVRVLPDGRLVAETTFFCAPDTVEWVTYAGAIAATITLRDGPDAVAGLIAETGATPARATHPTSGPRRKPDEMLELPGQLEMVERMRAERHGPNPWTEPRVWDEAVRTTNEMGMGFATSGGLGLSAEFVMEERRSGRFATAALPGSPPTALLRGELLDHPLDTAWERCSISTSR